jgi:uncharacterized protein YqeY
MIAEQIDQDLKAAMLAKDEVKKLTLRGVKKEIIEAKTAPGANGEISDDQVLKIIAKLVKQRKDSATVYEQQGRTELAANELAESAILELYLPKQLSPAELESALREIIAEVGATGPKEMGKVMGLAGKKLAGLAEGRLISDTVKNLLNAL